MILRNISFQNDFPFEADHFNTIEISSPRLYARVIQSMVSLENGDEPLEKFMFLENDIAVNASKILSVITDPFTMDINSKKFVSLLHAKLEKILVSDIGKYTEWRMHILQANGIIEEILQQIIPDIICSQEISVQDFAKMTGCRFELLTNKEVSHRLYTLLDITGELFPDRILVFFKSISIWHRQHVENS